MTGGVLVPMSVRVSPEERDLWAQAADKAHARSVSMWIRQELRSSALLTVTGHDEAGNRWVQVPPEVADLVQQAILAATAGDVATTEWVVEHIEAAAHQTLARARQDVVSVGGQRAPLLAPSGCQHPTTARQPTPGGAVCLACGSRVPRLS